MINGNIKTIQPEVEVMKDMVHRIELELQKPHFCPHYIKEKRDIFDRAFKRAVDEMAEQGNDDVI